MKTAAIAAAPPFGGAGPAHAGVPPGSAAGADDVAGQGIWAPGIRLFRRISFQAKALILSTTFILPLAVLSFDYFSGMQERIAVAQTEHVDELILERNLRIAMLAASLLLAGYVFVSFSRVMRGGMREVSLHLKAMTDGDLTSSPRALGRDEAATLMHDLAVMQASLRKIVTQVRDSSGNMTTASDEVAAASTDLSTRTEQAASHTEQAARSMEDISATLRVAAEKTQHAATLAAENAEVARAGGISIDGAVATMEQIKASSRRITEIISVIDGIAFQTNILALNAAVEAARAGEQGRGFAVVAGEVRSLAARSATAAKEIEALIKTSVGQIQSGTDAVQGAGRHMRQIVDSAGQVRALLSEISAAGTSNSAEIVRIGSAIGEIEQMTQQNAALVEQTTATAGAMKQRAVDLAAAVAMFKLTADSSGMKRKRLSKEITASPQVSLAELDALKQQGYRALICNRPDNEGPGQPSFAQIERAARDVGLQARHLPVEPGKATPADAAMFLKLMDELPKPIMAFCRTGMRSAALWKMSHPGQATIDP
jgi:uncharacterized protein (TIGR01244 family)